MSDLLQMLVGMVFSPSYVFRQLKLRWLILRGVVITVLAQVPWIFLYIALIPKETASEMGTNGLLIFILTNLGARLVLLVLVYALVLWGIGKLLGGDSSFVDMLHVTLFSNVPAFLIIPVLFISIGLGDKGLTLLNVTRYVMELWYFLLVVIGVREMQGFTILKTIVATIVLPIVVIMLLQTVAMYPILSKYLPMGSGPNN